MSLPRFQITSESYHLAGEPHYALADYAFAFDMSVAGQDGRKALGATTSLVIGTLQLEIEIETSHCIYLWGYCPAVGWRRSPLPSHDLVPRAGGLKVTCETPLVPGVSIGIEEMVPSLVWFDPATGWVCVGRPESDATSQAVEFASDTIAVVSEARLRSVWVRPRNWKDLVNSIPDR